MIFFFPANYHSATLISVDHFFFWFRNNLIN